MSRIVKFRLERNAKSLERAIEIGEKVIVNRRTMEEVSDFNLIELRTVKLYVRVANLIHNYNIYLGEGPLPSAIGFNFLSTIVNHNNSGVLFQIVEDYRTSEIKYDLKKSTILKTVFEDKTKNSFSEKFDYSNFKNDELNLISNLDNWSHLQNSLSHYTDKEITKDLCKSKIYSELLRRYRDGNLLLFTCKTE